VAADVDVIVVAYRSTAHLRACVEPLAGETGITVTVVDNDCPERSPETVRDLPVRILPMGRNAGFGAACNAGAAGGTAPAILFLNPDAEISAADVRALAAAFDESPGTAALGPRLRERDGSLQPSMRRFPTLRSAFAEAAFLHRAFPHAAWATETVWTGYDEPQAAEWLSGAVLAVRRSAFEAAGGFDERFFMYCEDIDLCKRLEDAGGAVRYTPAAAARHAGGASVPRPALVPLKVRSKLLYARLHERGARYAGFRAAIVLTELLHLPVAAARREQLRPRLAALGAALASQPPHS
jgi:hypothetical protein